MCVLVFFIKNCPTSLQNEVIQSLLILFLSDLSISISPAPESRYEKAPSVCGLLLQSAAGPAGAKEHLAEGNPSPSLK